jgi:uncharacterized RDD family membrane protein YckC
MGRGDPERATDTLCGVNPSASSTPPAGTTYPGLRLGLPAEGPGSVASWSRRVAALLVDWFASRLVAGLLVGEAVWTRNGIEQLWVFVVFVLETTVLTALAGGSFGQLVFRVSVVRLDGKPVSLLQALVRTVLICLVIPPLVFNADQRGLHDLAAGTVTLRR